MLFFSPLNRASHKRLMHYINIKPLIRTIVTHLSAFMSLLVLLKHTLFVPQCQYQMLPLDVICRLFCWHPCPTVHIVITHIYVFLLFLAFSPAPVSRFVSSLSFSLTISKKFDHQSFRSFLFSNRHFQGGVQST